MIRHFRRPRVVVSVMSALVLVAVGAGAAGAQSNEVFVSGSSTVEPTTGLVAELYAEEAPDVSIRVDGPGTGDGFQLFCNGETDISDASRPIEDEEVELCESNGVEYVELQVAIDGLSIITNKANKALKCLTMEDIYSIFGPESGATVDLADSSEVAAGLGTSKQPKKGELTKFTPGEESGTYDSFIELTFEPIMEERLEAGELDASLLDTDEEGEQFVVEPQVSAGTFPDDNDILQRVESSDTAIGYFGYAYFEQNPDADIKVVKVADPETGKCVKPTRKTIESGAYPIARPLFIYPNTGKVAENQALKDFVDFYMTEDILTDAVTQSGYVPASAETIEASIDAWKSASG